MIASLKSRTPSPSNSSTGIQSDCTISEEDSKSQIISCSSSNVSKNDVQTFDPLDSLTTAAASVLNYSQGTQNYYSSYPLIIIDLKSGKSSENSQITLNPTTHARTNNNVSLPPISKVFPQHFGSQESVPLPKYYHHQQPHPQQYHGYPPSRPFMNSTYGALKQINPAMNPPYANHIPPMIQRKSYPSHKGGNPVNYYHSALGIKHQTDSQSPPFNDRKRSSYNCQAHSQNDVAKMVRSAILHNTSKSPDALYNNGASTIQVKLNFRNFAIQLSSKSTNLTSNQSGTASSDKEHFAAVMQDSVIVSSSDLIHSFSNYKPTVNNKLKPLKFNEYLQEQIFMHYSGTIDLFSKIPPREDCVFLYKTPESLLDKVSGMSRYKVFRHSRTLGIAVYRKGQRIFPVTPEDISDFWLESPKSLPIVAKEHSSNDFRTDDLVMICRGYSDGLLNEADSLAEDASKVPPGGDLDDILPQNGHVLDDLKGETGVVMAIIGTEFDQHMIRCADLRIRHVIHVEKTGHTAIDDPWPYAITKHTLVLRPYLAMLFSDASKINRFSPTIEFVIKKAMAAPCGEPITRFLSKLSDVQHMVAGIVIGSKLKYWATGGAFLIHLRKDSQKPPDWIVSFPGIDVWSTSSSEPAPILLGEIDIKPSDCLLLCCPEIRFSWAQSELVSIIKSRALWPEKFQAMTSRLKEEKNSKNGLGLYEISPPN